MPLVLNSHAGLQEMKDAASLHAWAIAESLTKGDLTPFQQAYVLNEIAAATLKLSIDLVDGQGLAGIMADVLRGAAPAKCRTHPRYMAKRSPRTLCGTCWDMWNRRATDAS